MCRGQGQPPTLDKPFTWFANSPDVSRVYMRSVQTQRSTHHHGSRGAAAPACLGVAATTAGRSSWSGSSRIHFSASLRSTAITRLSATMPAPTGFATHSKTRHPHRPKRVHRDRPPGRAMLRTGRSRSVALHPASWRRSYGSIPHGPSPHRSRLSRLYPLAFSGTRARRPVAALQGLRRSRNVANDPRTHATASPSPRCRGEHARPRNRSCPRRRRRRFGRWEGSLA